jgi:hypothetical protein
VGVVIVTLVFTWPTKVPVALNRLDPAGLRTATGRRQLAIWITAGLSAGLTGGLRAGPGLPPGYRGPTQRGRAGSPAQAPDGRRILSAFPGHLAVAAQVRQEHIAHDDLGTGDWPMSQPIQVMSKIRMISEASSAWKVSSP